MVGARAAAATPAPVPVRLTVCVDPDTLFALSVIVMLAVRAPTAAGLKVTEIVQLAPVTKVAPQVLDSA